MTQDRVMVILWGEIFPKNPLELVENVRHENFLITITGCGKRAANRFIFLLGK